MRTLFLALSTVLSVLFNIQAQEIIFADYFDIKTNSPGGTPVIGCIHLERNKDVTFSKIPVSYYFEIINQEKDLFTITTTFDHKGRIKGTLFVNDGQNTGAKEITHKLNIVLKNNSTILNKFEIKVKVLNQTLWELFYERYMKIAPYSPRMYGEKDIPDSEVTKLIDELQKNDGRFEGFHCYDTSPCDYLQLNATAVYKGEQRKNVSIDFEWINIANKIGSLGYAYYHSKVYGIKGDSQKHALLKGILLKALNIYTAAVPIEGDEVIINGKSIGKYTGDATSLLPIYKLAQAKNMEHQWRFTDPLLLPILTLMPDIIQGINNGDKESIELHNNLINYFQLFTALVKARRKIINNPRWGNIVDPHYSSGAWADANLGHRSRTLLALPIIWGDYNRPMTYVQYWYKDFYSNRPFDNFSLSPGWSPCGVVKDVRYWMTKFCITSHHYKQSGFHPDGTVSHHIGQGTDAAMVAYGFELLTECNNGYAFFKDTQYEIESRNYQFQLDRLLNVYPKLFYKGQMDFLISGRTFLSDLKQFVSKSYNKAVYDLYNAKGTRTRLIGIDSLLLLNNKLQEGKFKYSGTNAYWVNEFLTHRRETDKTSFYASVKLKSDRTVGAEDFSKIRKSWHAAYGILQLKVRGDEYDQQVLSNMDWHALPGLTEEWRNDPMPASGGAAASLAGNNKIAGVLSDGIYGMGMYHHYPRETYSSATALKSYHFIEDRILSLGNNIRRIRKGQEENIHTFIEQTRLYDTLSWCVDGKSSSASPSESIDMKFSTKKPCWLHMGRKGYIIIPTYQVQVNIKTGTFINITDQTIANQEPNFIISINHGVNPTMGSIDNNYAFYQIPNVSKTDMIALIEKLPQEISYTYTDSIHAVYSSKENIYQFAFFAPGKIRIDNVEIASEDASMIMFKEKSTEWIMSVGNPKPDGKKQILRFKTNIKLPQGIYPYNIGGIYPLQGETVSIQEKNNSTEVVVELPDIRDEKQYNYQTDLYSAAPIVIKIPK